MTGRASSAKAAVGDKPVFAYIGSLPEPQRSIAERVDALAARTLPNLQRSVKWGMAWYGVGDGWCFSCGGFVGHVKLTFGRGTALTPVPPVTPIGMGKDSRGVDLESVDDIDEAQLASWMRQATALPGFGESGEPASSHLAGAGPSPLPDRADLRVLLVGDVLEAQRHEHARRRVRTGLRVRDDVIDLAAGHGTLHQGPGRGGPEPLAPERGRDLVADLDGAVDRPAGEATRAEQPPGRGVDEELHRPPVIGLRRGLEMVQGEADGFRELGPAVRHG